MNNNCLDSGVVCLEGVVEVGWSMGLETNLS